MMTLAVVISIAAAALMVWSAKNSHGGAYQKHNSHPSHFFAYLSYALGLSVWGLIFYADNGRAGPLLLVIMGLYFLWKSLIAFRAWRRSSPIEL